MTRPPKPPIVHRLLGLLRAEFWPIEGDEFDLVLACAPMRGGK